METMLSCGELWQARELCRSGPLAELADGVLLQDREARHEAQGNKQVVATLSLAQTRLHVHGIDYQPSGAMRATMKKT